MDLYLTSPDMILPGEILYKFILPGSDLYRFLFELKMHLIKNNFQVLEDPVDFNVQVINDRCERFTGTMEEASNEIEGAYIDVYNKRNYGIIENNIVLFTPTPYVLHRTKSHIKFAKLENKNHNIQKAFLFIMDRIDQLIPLK
jgi:hypothetical protein